MAYTAEISRANPSCFLFLIDQSGSMDEDFGAAATRKSQALADAINKILKELCLYCARGEDIRDFFHIGVIGYGEKVGSAFTGKLAGRDLVPVSEIATNPARTDDRKTQVPDGSGGLVTEVKKMPVWFNPVNSGGTPMCAAFSKAHNIMSDWIHEHGDCYPPIVINITDGEANDGDPKPVARELRELSSSDGNVLVFNAHISSSNANSIEFPSSATGLPDEYAEDLFEMSSKLPEKQCAFASELGFAVNSDSRGFVFNADIVSVIKFLDVGTKMAKLLR